MRDLTRSRLQTTLGELIEALYSATKAFVGIEKDASIVVAFILNDILAKQSCPGYPRGRQLHQGKKAVGNETQANKL